MSLLNRVIKRHWQKATILRSIVAVNSYGSKKKNDWNEVYSNVNCVLSANKISYEDSLEKGVWKYRKTTHKCRFLLGQDVKEGDRVVIDGNTYDVRIVEWVQGIWWPNDHLLSFIDKIEWVK